jgi:hypothetical protein
MKISQEVRDFSQEKRESEFTRKFKKYKKDNFGNEYYIIDGNLDGFNYLVQNHQNVRIKIVNNSYEEEIEMIYDQNWTPNVKNSKIYIWVDIPDEKLDEEMQKMSEKFKNQGSEVYVKLSS